MRTTSQIYRNSIIKHIIKQVLTCSKNSTVYFFHKICTVWIVNRLAHSVKVSNQVGVFSFLIPIPQCIRNKGCASQKEQFDRKIIFMKIRHCWKFDPTWPFNDLSITSSWNTIYFCDPYNLTSNLIHMKGHFKYFESLTPIWLPSSKNLSKYFPTSNDFEATNTFFFQYSL